MQQDDDSDPPGVWLKAAYAGNKRVRGKNLGVGERTDGVQLGVGKESIRDAFLSVRNPGERPGHADSSARVVKPLLLEQSHELFEHAPGGRAVEELAARAARFQDFGSIQIGLVQSRSVRLFTAVRAQRPQMGQSLVYRQVAQAVDCD